VFALALFYRFGCLKGAGSRSQNHLAAKPIGTFKKYLFKNKKLEKGSMIINFLISLLDENKEAETSFIREKINNNGSSRYWPKKSFV